MTEHPNIIRFRARLRRALDTKVPRKREIIRGRDYGPVREKRKAFAKMYVEGKSTRQIAEHFGVPMDTVRSDLYRFYETASWYQK